VVRGFVEQLTFRGKKSPCFSQKGGFDRGALKGEFKGLGGFFKGS